MTETDLLDRIWDVAMATTPFGVALLMVAIWWMNRAHNTSRDGWIGRVKELEKECSDAQVRIETLQQKRLDDFKMITDLVSSLTQSQIANTAAMQQRSETSAGLTKAVEELLYHIKFLLQSRGGIA